MTNKMKKGKNIFINKQSAFLMFFSLSFMLAFYKILIHLKFIPLPLFFLAFGLMSYRLFAKKSLYIFCLLLPLVSASADFLFNGYAFNYMSLILFYLAGIIIAEFFLPGKASLGKNYSTASPAVAFNEKWMQPYLLFLVILWISALFVFLRWSNITLPGLASWMDTPVTPSGERVSFASIFPVVALFLYSTTPFLPVLMKKNKLDADKVFGLLLVGYIVSFHVALFQKFVNPDFMAIKWWGEKLNQYNGGFSDFNAFGFFSGALFLYFVIAFVNHVTTAGFKYDRSHLLKHAFIRLVAGPIVTLAGIFLSGCRTAFIFILAAIVYLLFTKKIKLQYKIVSILLIAILLAIAGGTLKKRILLMVDNVKKVSSSGDIITAIDKVTNSRIEMMQRSIPIIKNYPITGIGTGNFLFFLKYDNLGKQYWEDLPLNQYLLILDETGIAGLALFAWFLVALMRQKRRKRFFYLLLTMLVAIFFNFFFWFPEILVFTWIVASFTVDPATDQPDPGKKSKLFTLAVFLLLVIYALFNILSFDSLHPKTWCKAKDREYSYGLWYLEKTPQDEAYRWTKKRAGVYLFLDETGKSKPFKLFCGAPLDRLPGKKQLVEIFWQGKLFKKISFQENKEFVFTIEGQPQAQGFLEIHVTPTFNLKKLKISPEPRDLGIQFFTLY